MKSKLVFNYPIEETLSAVLSMQAIQKTLEKDFKIKYFDFSDY
jgi:hypothetical protein